MTQVTCAQCANFIPDKGLYKMRDGTTYGDGSGIGRCKQFDEYLDKNPKAESIKRANIAIGNKLLYPNIERFCTKFKNTVPG